MKTKYEEIVNVERIGEKGVTDISGVLSLAKRERIRTASQDKVRRMLLCIDMQKDFKVAKYALILGEDEISAGKVTVKNLDTSEQKTVAREDLLKEIL